MQLKVTVGVIELKILDKLVRKPYTRGIQIRKLDDSSRSYKSYHPKFDSYPLFNYKMP